MKWFKKMLPIAIESIEKFGGGTKATECFIQKEFKGYVTSFGVSVRQSGVEATIAFFADKGKAHGDRDAVLPAIIYVLLKQGYFDDALQVNDTHKISWLEKLNTIEKYQYDIYKLAMHLYNAAPTQFEQEVMRVTVGLKLAARLFSNSDNENN